MLAEGIDEVPAYRCLSPQVGATFAVLGENQMR